MEGQPVNVEKARADAMVWISADLCCFMFLLFDLPRYVLWYSITVILSGSRNVTCGRGRYNVQDGITVNYCCLNYCILTVCSKMLVRIGWLQMFDAGKTRMIGLPYGEKLWQYVKPFSSDTGMLRTDGQTDRIAMSISRVSVLSLTRDKNKPS